MFSCELKFVIDLLKKWLAKKRFRRYKELDFFAKQRFKTENSINWYETKCLICSFCLSTSVITYLDFVILVEHAFIRHIFDYDELKMSKSIQTLEKYYETYRNTLQIVALLNTNYSKDSDNGDISDDCVAEFINEMNFDSSADLYLEVENTEIKNMRWEDRKEAKPNKLITFVYYSLMDFPQNKFEIKTVMKKGFFKGVRNLLYGSHVIHHFHVTGEIVGYAHNFCNKKVRENQNLIPAFAHNLFSFDFFFVVKGIRLCVWRIKQVSIGGTNLTNVQYSSIGTKVKLIDTIKYYQQSLSSLTKNANYVEKKNVRQSCRRFIENKAIFSLVFNSLSDENQNWVLEYLCEVKGVIPYEKIKTDEDLNCVPEGDFFTKTEFYSSLKNKIISDEDYENVSCICD